MAQVAVSVVARRAIVGMTVPEARVLMRDLTARHPARIV